MQRIYRVVPVVEVTFPIGLAVSINFVFYYVRGDLVAVILVPGLSPLVRFFLVHLEVWKLLLRGRPPSCSFACPQKNTKTVRNKV